MKAAPPVDSPVQRCTVLSQAGAYISDGLAVVIDRGVTAEVRLTELTEPGALLNAHLGRGARRFLLSLEDGRTVGATLMATSWQSPGRRMCRFDVVAGGQGSGAGE
jgi:hypothetical protein